MRLLKHLTEAGISDIPREFWNEVRRKCQPFLKDWMYFAKRYKNKDHLPFLWRGMSTGGEWNIKNVRKDRKPDMSSPEFHKALDDMLMQVHKVRGRSQSMFTSGDYWMANRFGTKVAIVFPVGRYKILWNPKAEDIYYDGRSKYGWRNKSESDYMDYAMSMKVDRNDPEVRKELTKMMDNQNMQAIRNMADDYQTTGLEKAINSRNEIMIDCDQYLWIDEGWKVELTKIIKDWL